MLFSTLFLICCHGDVKLLLHNYVKGEGLRSEGLDTPLNGRTFHYLHDYLEEDTWQRITSLCVEGTDIRIQFILVSEINTICKTKIQYPTLFPISIYDLQ